MAVRRLTVIQEQFFGVLRMHGACKGTSELLERQKYVGYVIRKH